MDKQRYLINTRAKVNDWKGFEEKERQTKSIPAGYEFFYVWALCRLG